MAKPLTQDEKDRINKIAACISKMDIRAIAVIYFGFTNSDLLDMENNMAGDYINQWIRKGGSYQELAPILYHAAENHSLLAVDKIKEHLHIRKGDFEEFKHKPGGVNSFLTESELGRLAMKINKAKLRQLATLMMKMDHVELDINEDMDKGTFVTRFQVFDKWNSKTDKDNKRKYLAHILYEGAKEHALLSIWDIEPILNVSKEQADEYARGAAGDATDGHGGSVDAEKVKVPEQGQGSGDATGSNKQVDDNKKIQVAVKPVVREPLKLGLVEPVQSDLKQGLDSRTPPPGVAAAASDAPLSDLKAVISKSEPMTLEAYKSWQDPYEWLGMEQIRQLTGPLTSGLKRDVVVAVIDTGIYQHFHIPDGLHLSDFISDSHNIIQTFELRNKLRNTETMRHILQSMKIQQGALSPWDEGFNDTTLKRLLKKCSDALKAGKKQTMALPGIQLWEFTDRYLWCNMREIRDKTAPMTKKVKPVVVAVLDTGIYEDFHIKENKKEGIEEFKLKDYILTDKSLSFHPGPGQDDDLREDSIGHGTFVAGIIVLNGPVNVKIVNIKVLGAPWESMIDALKHVKDMDEVDIINISGGGLKCPELTELEDKIREIAGKKIIIASAGNDSVLWPAKDPNVISVGRVASNKADQTARGEQVDILCPKKDVASFNSAYTGIPHGQAPYIVCDGTSFAAPYVCAVAAHVLVAYEARLLETQTINPKTRKPYTKDEARKVLTYTRVMRDILQSMGSNELLSPWQKSFDDLDDLMRQCKKAREGKTA